MPKKKWSREVAARSNALDLPPHLFTRSAKQIAAGLKESAQERSPGRSKARTDYQAAMSMLNFYVNRAGTNLSARDRARLNNAKRELRRSFGRDL
ncbi:MAG: DUF3175 domain-containing protein [Phycisphaerales bacterium]|nr:DUF3175 domain-containing protein [Phycisphaerales bacterium]